jgi:hypothetical protein
VTNDRLLLTVQLAGLNTMFSSSSCAYHEVFGGREGTDPLILNVHNKWMHAISFTPTERQWSGRLENCYCQESNGDSLCQLRRFGSVEVVRSLRVW